MVLIPSKIDPTLAEIDNILEREHAANNKRRDYIGASSIGDSCSRKLWYRLNEKDNEVFDAATIRRFNDGHRSEAIIIDLLRKVPGIELHTYNQETGEQYGFVDGKFKGHYDGIIHGILEAPLTWHIFEAKCVNEKSFEKLKKLKQEDEKTALKNWNPVYYGQAVTYMDYEGLTRHYMIVCTPGVRDYISIRTEANPTMAAALRLKAKRISEATEAPERIGGPDWWECRFCYWHGKCHGT